MVDSLIVVIGPDRYATILAFDVKVTHDAQVYADEVGVRIFTANIIYHLTDQFEKFMADTLKAAQESASAEAVFPVICRIVPTAIFNAKNPIVLGMDIVEGSLRIGTPLCVVRDDVPGAEVGLATFWKLRVLVCTSWTVGFPFPAWNKQYQRTRACAGPCYVHGAQP
jgi:translation initiation factor 5B